MSSPSPSTCSICLATAQARGGVPLFAPGCCGAWYHQSCIEASIAGGNKNCPMCRHILPLPAPAPIVATVPVADQTVLQFIQQQQNIQRPPLQPAQVQQRRSSAPLGMFGRMSQALSQVFSLSPSDEDQVSPPPARRASASAAAPSASSPVLTITTSPELPELSLAENPSFYVRVNVKYEDDDATAEQKVPLDVVCVLDNSGSMSGGKLASLKTAMEFVISTLGKNDRLSVVNFNSHATTLHGLKKMNPANQRASTAQLRDLRATGGTNILEGMQQGWSILEDRKTKNPASCMFLLTDGQDRDSLDAKLELSRTIKACGTSLFVFGFGTDHDSEHMVSNHR